VYKALSSVSEVGVASSSASAGFSNSGSMVRRKVSMPRVAPGAATIAAEITILPSLVTIRT
jgi:hypothetical protein